MGASAAMAGEAPLQTGGVEATEGDIVDQAIAIAERVGWDNIRLRDVASAAGIPLATLISRFRDADAIADAWFARGRAAMLADDPPAHDPLAHDPLADDAFADDALADDAGAHAPLAADLRLERAMLRWFDALAPHRRVTREMLATKLWPFHPHHWVPMIFSLSRLVQLWRDVGRLDAGGPRRAVEEVALTWLFLATLAVWVSDGSTDQQRTRSFLRVALANADSAARRCFGEPPNKSAADPLTPSI